jgi:hypothetical protein
MKIRKSLNEDLNKIKAKAAVGIMRSLTLHFEEQDIRKLKAKAALEGVKMSDILRKLIKEHI